jgi:hypothetical protein
MPLFGGAKGKVRNLEASLLAAKVMYDLDATLPPEAQARVRADFGKDVRAAYQAAVTAGAALDAARMISDYRGKRPNGQPADLPTWDQLMDAVTS